MTESTRRRSRNGLPLPVPEITALIDPRLTNAQCKVRAPLFDSLIPGETEDQRHARLIWAANLCAQCPVRAACARVAAEHDAHGIWGGQHQGPYERAERGRGTGPRVRARGKKEAA